MLPVRYWAMHPFYFADVRMTAAHVAALTSLVPGRNDFHILYDAHPISKVEVAGVVMAVALRGDKRIMTLDDGTGSVQAVVFSRHFDGSVARHYEAGVGDAVVVAGKVAYAWRAGGVNDMCREVRVRTIRPLVAPDELAAHLLTTLAAHVEHYARPLDAVLTALPLARVLAGGCAPLAPEAAALAPFQRPRDPPPYAAAGAVLVGGGGGGGGGGAVKRRHAAITGDDDGASTGSSGRSEGDGVDPGRPTSDDDGGGSSSDDDGGPAAAQARAALAGYIAQLLDVYHPDWWDDGVEAGSAAAVASAAGDALPRDFTAWDVATRLADVLPPATLTALLAGRQRRRDSEQPPPTLRQRLAAACYRGVRELAAAGVVYPTSRSGGGGGGVIGGADSGSLPPACLAHRWRPVSHTHVLAPAILACLSMPPPAAARRARMPTAAAEPARHAALINEWTLGDLQAALHARRDTARVPRHVVLSSVWRLRDASLVVATGSDRFALEEAAPPPPPPLHGFGEDDA